MRLAISTFVFAIYINTAVGAPLPPHGMTFPRDLSAKPLGTVFAPVASPLPSLGFAVRALVASFALGYAAFQKKLLPLSLSRFAARLYFWPTLPFTLGLRRGNLMTVMDSTVLVGVAPVAFSAQPHRLHALGVRGVVNLCDEFRGDSREYARLGVEHLWLPTVDHFEPSVQHLRAAVEFIGRYKDRGEQVYVHCKAGHGRSAAVVFCWLFTQSPHSDPEAIAREMEFRRKVRKNIHLQPNVALFVKEHQRKLRGD